MKQYYVYFMTNKSGTLYLGVTNNLSRRVTEHSQSIIKGFSEKYRIKKLVYYETFTDVREAIVREKQLKRWRREKKIELIEKVNPEWKDMLNEE